MHTKYKVQIQSIHFKMRHVLVRVTAKYSQGKFQLRQYKTIIISFIFEVGFILPSPV